MCQTLHVWLPSACASGAQGKIFQTAFKKLSVCGVSAVNFLFTVAVSLMEIQ
jgi:hypothetical protein